MKLKATLGNAQHRPELHFYVDKKTKQRVDHDVENAERVEIKPGDSIPEGLMREDEIAFYTRIGYLDTESA